MNHAHPSLPAPRPLVALRYDEPCGGSNLPTEYNRQRDDRVLEIVERREPKETERKHLYVLDEALSGFGELRAGYMGCLRLRASSIASDTDPLFSVSRVWESVTPYTVTRHTKKGSATEALSADLCAECYRRGLPKPVVIPGELRGIPGTGLSGAARLAFPVPVQGPLILGKNRYLGGGLFVGKSLE
jgi:CRISPR-associated protein Csb2